MLLASVDWTIIGLFFLLCLAIGLGVSRKAGSSTAEFFLSGRHMPWWLLGISMVATTFAADTPALVTDIVRNNGVAGNWVWWAFLLMLKNTPRYTARKPRRNAAGLPL